MSATDATNLISGDAGTKVELVTRRSGVEETKTISRRKITLESVERRMIGDFGYIKILEFNNASVSQFNDAVNWARNQGAKGIIFDVRNNGGGTLLSVCDMLDLLLPEGPIAYQYNRENGKKTIARSDKSEILLPMTCLINENTASAAELFAAALRDYDKADLIGTNTYGKGVLQTTYKLSDGSGVCITTGYFYPPMSQNFDGVGVSPDYSITLTSSDNSMIEGLDETTDAQLIKAIEVLSGKTSK
jgi:carboxyl-terminal processing protease